MNYFKDEENPKYIFQTTNTSILIKALKGEIDLDKIIREELINRGLDDGGVWVGHEKAEEIWMV